MGEIAEFDLPFPPSLNRYYRHWGARVLISAAGRKYREVVVARIKEEGIEKIHGDVELTVDAYPPDARRRDADNLEKCLWDSLTAGGLVDDDSCFKRHTTTMWEPIREMGGFVHITAKPFKH